MNDFEELVLVETLAEPPRPRDHGGPGQALIAMASNKSK
jgi:hypothetical protein